MSGENWPRLDDDERALQLDKDHHYRSHKDGETHPRRADSPAPIDRPGWLSLLGALLFAFGVGGTLLRWLEIWRPADCPLLGSGPLQQLVSNVFSWCLVLAAYLSLVMVVIALLVAVVSRSNYGAYRGLLYRSSIVFAAALGGQQLLVLGGSFNCLSAGIGVG